MFIGQLLVSVFYVLFCWLAIVYALAMYSFVVSHVLVMDWLSYLLLYFI